MTMAIPETSAPPAPQPKLRVALIALGAIMALRTIVDSPIISFEFGDGTLKTSLGATLPHALAATALVFAAKRRLRHALITLAAIVLVEWLSALAMHELQASMTLKGLIAFAQQFIYPVLAIATIVLALRDKRLALAAAFVALPIAIIGVGIT